MHYLDRFELLIGNENINKIKNTRVLVLGCGGVGSYTIESLVRSGIGTIVIVDFDVIDESNLNRQLMTNKNNIGKYKVDELEKRINEISDSKVIKIKEFINKENIDVLFNYNIDYIVDACDFVETKCELIKKCKEKNVKLISSMGTGNKLNPSKFEIIDIRKTNYDPLAKKIRKFVKDENIKGKVMVVCSSEKPLKRAKIGSTSFIPATAGLLITSYIINYIIGEIC